MTTLPPAVLRLLPSFLILLFAALCPDMALAQAALSEAEPLRNGAYRWAEVEPAAATHGSLSITVSIADQRLYVYDGARLLGISTVSTGTRGHATPRGDFTILQKDRWHRSNIYSNAPMPYMQRLTWGGIAMHGGHLPGYPASHGCIRLPHAFARRLFAITSLGVPVTIVDDHRRPLVTLRFADIDWLATSDADLSSPVAAGSAPHWLRTLWDPRARLDYERLDGE